MKNNMFWAQVFFIASVCFALFMLVLTFRETPAERRTIREEHQTVQQTRFEVAKVTCYHNDYGLQCLKD